METYEELLKRDKRRENDGFPKKIKTGRIMSRSSGKIVTVPTTVEEKLIHGDFEPGQDGDLGGQGEGQEGDVIGEGPLHEGEGEGDASQPGGQSGGEHGIEEKAKEIGEKLSEKYDLPNLADRGKKIPVDEYNLELTDRNKKTGQVLDTEETCRRIVETNWALGLLNPDNIDTSSFIVAPDDMVYRVLSRERVFKSMAVVFLIRDYSGSMSGDPARVIIDQHMLIYAWLMHQYEELVIPRFVVHDYDAKEVTKMDYFNLKVAGGTRVASAFKLVGDIIVAEGLVQNYNIYVFHGTDGDDWDTEGKEAIPAINKVLSLGINRMGICVARNKWTKERDTEVERYIYNSGLLEKKKIFRFFPMPAENVNEEMNVRAIKHLIGTDQRG